MKWMRALVVLVAAWGCAEYKDAAAGNAAAARSESASEVRLKGEDRLKLRKSGYFGSDGDDRAAEANAPAPPPGANPAPATPREPALAFKTIVVEQDELRDESGKSDKKKADDGSFRVKERSGAKGKALAGEDLPTADHERRIAKLEEKSETLKSEIFDSKARLRLLRNQALAGKDANLDGVFADDGPADLADVEKEAEERSRRRAKQKPKPPAIKKISRFDNGRSAPATTMPKSGEARGPGQPFHQEVSALAQSARLTPQFAAGRTRGLKVSGLTAGAATLGLKNGDVLLSINGQTMTTPNAAFQTYRRTQGAEGPVHFEIERGGQRLRYTLNDRGEPQLASASDRGQTLHGSRWQIDDDAWLGRADLHEKPASFLPRMFYFENTYLGRTAAFQERLRRLDSALGAHDLGGTTLDPQRLDPPADAGISVTTALDQQHLDEPGRVILQVALQGSQRYGWRRPPLDLAVVLDPLALAHAPVDAKRMLDRLLSRLGPKDRLGVVLATNPPRVLIDVQALRDARSAIANLDGQVRAAGVDLAGGMRTAGARLLAASEGQARVPGSQTLVVLTAGKHAPGDAAGVAHALTVQGAVTSVVDLGGGWRWWAVANAGHGQLYSGPDVIAAVDGELERVSKVVARLLRVNIKLADGVEAIRVLGSRMLDDDEVKAVKAREVATDLQISKTMGVKADRGDDDDGIQTVIPFFHGGDAHVILVELWVDKARRSMPVADVTLRYKDMVALKNATARSHVSLSSLPQATTPAELLVRRNVRGFELAEALGRASVLVARGDDAGARRLLDAAVAGSSRDRALVGALKHLLAQSVDVSVKRAALAYAGQRRISHVAMPRR